MFKGVKYDYWKERMIDHFKSMHIDLWDMFKNGNHIPYDDELNEIQGASGQKRKNSNSYLTPRLGMFCCMLSLK